MAEYELWQYVERTGGSDPGYRWMVWKVGPMHGMDAHWFDSEDDARERLEALSCPECEARIASAGPQSKPEES